ncbi:alpha/beta hydrolase [Solimonas variicoloris]|uniref:alpha/beta hydrolase n=1 Tax=Solimonas variicoloris TaxID=254408 RepID=UPI00037E7C94|nr:alpha/beta hydrolase [Solimonas variicoloris]
MSQRPSLRALAWRRPVRWLLAPIFQSGRSVALRRRLLLRVAALTRLPVVRCTKIAADTLRGVPVEWVSSTRQTPRRVLLYFHGGAYIVGAARIYRAVNARLAEWAQARVAAVDYRLAPEHPFPAASQDALDAYRGLLERGIDPATIVLGGDSAGGGLALACALQIRDAGLPAPAGVVLFSPWTDLGLRGESIRSRAASELVLDADTLREAAAAYLGAQPADTPLASPLYADLHGLPPLLIQVTDTEILYDDALRFAERAKAAGGTVELRVWHSLWHVWQAFAGKLPEADAALREAAAFIVRHARTA